MKKVLGFLFPNEMKSQIVDSVRYVKDRFHEAFSFVSNFFARKDKECHAKFQAKVNLKTMMLTKC